MKFKGINIANIYDTGFLTFFIILGLQKIFLYSQLKLPIYILFGVEIYSGMNKVLKTFSRKGPNFVMLLIILW